MEYGFNEDILSLENDAFKVIKDNLYNETINKHFADFKKKYNKEKRLYLQHQLKTTKLIYELYKLDKIFAIPNIEFEKRITTPEELYKISKDFFLIFNDSDLNEMLDNVFNNNLLNIKNYNNDIINGLTFKTNNGIYLSFLKHDNISDFPAFIHELAHFYVMNYINYKNPLFNRVFPEFESFYFQILMNNYYGLSKGDYNKSLSLDLSFYKDILKRIWLIKIQDMMTRQLGNKFNLNCFNTLFNNTLGFKLQDEDIKTIMSYKLSNNIKLVNSYLLALELAYNSFNDYEYGIYTYNKMLASDIYDINNLLKTFDLDYTNKKTIELESIRIKSYRKKDEIIC